MKILKKQPYERNENRKSENSTIEKSPVEKGGGGGLSELEANMATFDVSNWFRLAEILSEQLPAYEAVS